MYACADYREVDLEFFTVYIVCSALYIYVSISKENPRTLADVVLDSTKSPPSMHRWDPCECETSNWKIHDLRI